MWLVIIQKKIMPKLILHKPFVDEVVLVSKSGEKMFREPDLIDVWFDSGAMPFAQHHYPFSPLPTSPKGGGEKTPKWKTARDSNYGLLKDLAKKQKENPTEAETFLWKNLKSRQLAGYKFRRAAYY